MKSNPWAVEAGPDGHPKHATTRTYDVSRCMSSCVSSVCERGSVSSAARSAAAARQPSRQIFGFTSYLTSPEFNEITYHGQEPLVLDWAIRYASSCEDAKKDPDLHHIYTTLVKLSIRLS
uniref:Uncharacterized protein n=1 Tax=Leersia perrieri TaxID=77586 RepID=A0A0D9W3V8_9ORYZ